MAAQELDLLTDLRTGAIEARKLTAEACRKFGYRVGTDDRGRPCHVAEYRDSEGAIIAQKLRYADKSNMPWRGAHKQAALFGQHLWSGGKRLCITEGEIDAVTVAQCTGLTWPVVSIKSGADGATKDVKANINFIESFDVVVFMFDMDEPGRRAAAACSALLTPGKAHIAALPYKDPNECLLKGKPDAVVQAFWNAAPYRPDGWVKLADIVDEAVKPIERGLPTAFPEMDAYTYGRRFGEIWGFGAGTGVGKTDLFTQQIAHDVTVLEQTVGVIFLEQVNSETANRIAGKIKGKGFHIPDGGWTDRERVDAIKELAATNRVVLYNNFGHTDWNRVKEIIRWAALNDGVKLFYLDHLTALADPNDERASLETIMEDMASLATQLGIWIGYISHLATPAVGSHEEGAAVSLKHFKGARAIGFWTHFAFGLERNKVAEDPEERCILTVRCIKDRLTGRGDGVTFRLKYNRKTCRLDPHGAAAEHGFEDPGFQNAPEPPKVTKNEEDDALPF